MLALGGGAGGGAAGGGGGLLLKNRYHVIEKVGEGTYGVVYKAMDVQDNQTVALKKIRLDLEQDGIPTTAIREVSLLKELQHENIIRLLDLVHLPQSLWLVFDYVDSDLKRCMDSQSNGLSRPTIQSYLHQLLVGIGHCHSRRVLHRDLKPQNLLIDRSSGRLRLADFGLSRTFRLPGRSHTHEVVTLWYRAPEVLLGAQHYTTAVDIWSVGCIFAEMLSGRAFFPGESEIDQWFRISKVLGTPLAESAPTLCGLEGLQPSFPRWKGEDLGLLLPGVDPLALSLLRSLLCLEPSRRPSAAAALQHPFFEGKAPRSVAAWPCESQLPAPLAECLLGAEASDGMPAEWGVLRKSCSCMGLAETPASGAASASLTGRRPHAGSSSEGGLFPHKAKAKAGEADSQPSASWLARGQRRNNAPSPRSCPLRSWGDASGSPRASIVAEAEQLPSGLTPSRHGLGSSLVARSESVQSHELGLELGGPQPQQPPQPWLQPLEPLLASSAAFSQAWQPEPALSSPKPLPLREEIAYTTQQQPSKLSSGSRWLGEPAGAGALPPSKAGGKAADLG